MANGNLVIKNAKIIFRNFSGNPDRFNKEGRRSFCVVLDHDFAQQLMDDGWNVKWIRPDRDGIVDGCLSISMNFENYPPNVWLITERSDGSSDKVRLDEASVGVLDWADIVYADINVRPYNWSVNGMSGRKAYLKDLYVTVQQDELAEKYRDI